jgi:hypothetical protein
VADAVGDGGDGLGMMGLQENSFAEYGGVVTGLAAVVENLQPQLHGAHLSRSRAIVVSSGREEFLDVIPFVQAAQNQNGSPVQQKAAKFPDGRERFSEVGGRQQKTNVRQIGWGVFQQRHNLMPERLQVTGERGGLRCLGLVIKNLHLAVATQSLLHIL